MTYHLLLKSLSSMLNNNIYYIWIKKLRGNLLHKPWCVRKLSSYLVRAKLYPIERKVGLCKCNGKHCEMWKNVLETDTFTCSNGQTNCKINLQFDGNEKRLAYLITCNKCLKQYVGQTVGLFRSQRYNYKDSSTKFDREEDCMQRHLYKHFQLPVHAVFFQGSMLLSLTRRILGHPLIMKITGFTPLRQKHL